MKRASFAALAGLFFLFASNPAFAALTFEDCNKSLADFIKQTELSGPVHLGYPVNCSGLFDDAYKGAWKPDSSQADDLKEFGTLKSQCSKHLVNYANDDCLSFLEFVRKHKNAAQPVAANETALKTVSAAPADAKTAEDKSKVEAESAQTGETRARDAAYCTAKKLDTTNQFKMEGGPSPEACAALTQNGPAAGSLAGGASSNDKSKDLPPQAKLKKSVNACRSKGAGWQAVGKNCACVRQGYTFLRASGQCVKNSIVPAPATAREPSNSFQLFSGTYACRIEGTEIPCRPNIYEKACICK